MGKLHISWKQISNMVAKLDSDLRITYKKTPIKVYGVPKNGWMVVKELMNITNDYIESSYEDCDIVVDDIIDSGRTAGKHKAAPFYALLSKKQTLSGMVCKFVELIDKGDWVVFPWEGTEQTSIEDNIVRLLQYIGEDPNREGLVDTPARVERSFKELYGGYSQNPDAILKAVFTEERYQELVVVKDIEFYSMCEHHMLPFYGKVHIGYLPEGKVVGLSKLCRLTDIFARRLQIQEKLACDIVDTIERVLKPKGCGCIIQAKHHCMMSRGVGKQNSNVITTSLRGEMLKEPLKSEFIRNCLSEK